LGCAEPVAKPADFGRLLFFQGVLFCGKTFVDNLCGKRNSPVKWTLLDKEVMPAFGSSSSDFASDCNQGTSASDIHPNTKKINHFMEMHKMKFKFRNLWAVILMVCLIWPAAASAAPQAYVVPSATVFINEIHYDNASTDTGEAVEIAGPAGTDLSGWELVLYNGNGGGAYNTNNLSGIIPDQQGGYGTIVFPYPTNGIQNGAPDGLALVDNNGSVLQFLSYEGSFSAVDGPAAGLTSTDIGVAESSSTLVGYSLQLSGLGPTYGDFVWREPQPATFGDPNIDQYFAPPANFPVSIDCGSTLYAYQGNAASRTITASDPDGTVVDISISDVTPYTDQITLDGVVPASAAGETASATLNVSGSIALGTYSVSITAINDDDPVQTADCTLTVVVNPVLTIGEVQGVVSDTDDGTQVTSPYDGQYVTVQGVIYQKTIAKTSWGGSYHGFFMQNTAATADGDPQTSDGIFVFMSTYTTLIGGHVPQVGDEVVINARVDEYFNFTELVSARLEQLVDTGLDVDSVVPAFEVEPPADLGDANRYWERHEGMRAQVPSGSLVLGGRDVFPSTMDGEVWVMRGDYAPLAFRDDPYARRSFRDPHPLDDIPGELFDNGNGYRIIMGSLGIKETFDDNNALIGPARTFDTLTNAPVGGVYFSFSKYQIMVGQQLQLENGVDPALNSPPQAYPRDRQYNLTTFNMENLYDYRNDPFDGCDFAGDSGCEGVYPPFDYVPASQAAYEERLNQIASQIVDDLHSPTVILAQEIEDQDICALSDGALLCDDVNNADGMPDPLEDLALVIAGMGGPQYLSAYDRDGADDRGIVSAYLYRADRAELLPVDAESPVFGADPQIDYRVPGLPYNSDVQNPKVFNADLPADVDTSTGVDGDYVFTRPPQVAHFRIWRETIGTSVFEDLFLLDNHFSSGPDGRVGQRTEQAAYNAAIVSALQVGYGDVRVSVGGDLNVYPRPDDPFPLHPSDQLAALYDQGLSNLYDTLLVEVPASAYTYVYQGQAQTLDQMFDTSVLLDELAQVRIAHINSDWPEMYTGYGPRRTSDHDPVSARYYLLPTLDRLEALLYYYDANGAISGNNTFKSLLHHLDQARKAYDRGDLLTYYDQLVAFANQVNGLSPQFVDPVAAEALSGDALLLSMLD
jgi:hypothetical protein